MDDALPEPEPDPLPGPPGSPDWPSLLAREFCPVEEPIAGEVARRYAEGGRSRRALFAESGEQTGGFGGGAPVAEIAVLLDTVAQSARVVLAFLDAHQGLGVLVESGAVVIAVVEARRSRKLAAKEPPTPEDSAEPSAAPAASAPEEALLPDDAVALVDDVLEGLAARLTVHGLTEQAAWARSCALLLLLERENPAGAAAFVRYLSHTDAARQDGARPEGARSGAARHDGARSGAEPGGDRSRLRWWPFRRPGQP